MNPNILTRLQLFALPSMLVPGLGQYLEKRYVSGTAFLITGVGAVTLAAISSVQYNSAVDSYDRARGQYLKAFTGDDIKTAEEKMRETYNNAESKFKFRQVAFGTLGIVWTANVLHAMIAGPAKISVVPETQAESYSWNITPQTTQDTVEILVWHRF